jgi:vacuolar-type H+-ATPase subunit I/STV1
MSDEAPSELAESYTEAVESQNEDDYEAAKERLNALEERLERFESKYGKSDPVTEELREKVQAAEEELEKIERERQEPEKLEQNLLQAATGFALDSEWLQPKVTKELNRILTGTPHPTLRVGGIELTSPDDVEDLGEVAQYDVIDVIRSIALDKLGEGDDLLAVWQSIEGSSKEGAFRVVAETGAADPDDVIAYLEEDIERSAARNRLKNAVYSLDINPYHREDGTYSLSTAGQYIAAEYAETTRTEDEDVTEDDSNDGQVTLIDETANGGANND